MMMRDVIQIVSWAPLATYFVFWLDLPFWDGLVGMLLAAIVVSAYLITEGSEAE